MKLSVVIPAHNEEGSITKTSESLIRTLTAEGSTTKSNRETGISIWKIREMGSRYLFIVLYLFLEKHLSQGDYRRVAVIDDDRVFASKGEK